MMLILHAYNTIGDIIPYPPTRFPDPDLIFQKFLPNTTLPLVFTLSVYFLVLFSGEEEFGSLNPFDTKVFHDDKSGFCVLLLIP